MTAPFSPEDIATFRSLGQLDCVPAHDLAAFAVVTTGLESDAYASAIWVADLRTGVARPFTRGTELDGSPRWSPDGERLAFLSTRESGTPQVHVMPRNGGEATQLTRLDDGVASLQWSPDGRWLAVASAMPVDPQARGKGARSAARKPGAPEVAWRLPYKGDGMGYLLDRQVHLFVVDAQSGDHRQVTHGASDVLSQAWSPEGDRIVVTRIRDGPEAHCADLWIVAADGSGSRRVTETVPTARSPAWSPDGRWIAFAGGREEGDAQVRLWLLDVATGRVRQWCDEDIELCPSAIRWSPDSKGVFAVVARRGCQAVVRFEVGEAAMREVVGGERHIAEISLSRGRLAFLGEAIAQPRELFSSDLRGGDERRATDLNGWWRERTPLRASRREFEVPDGRGGSERVEGWLVRARGVEGATPLLVDVHGCPTSYAMLGYPWHAYWNVLCSRGWSILALHAVGSASFGREFADRLNGHWGELDFPQHEAAVLALQREGVCDERVAIAGKSYGGFMSAWAIGHSGRFRAAIVSAPVANLESHIGTSDGGYYSDPYTLRGERHIERERYRDLSPVQHAHNAVTPTLILQGKEDERCPRGQAEELFAALRRASCAHCELVMYPGGGHHFFEQGRPSHRLDVLERMVEWLERWIGVPRPEIGAGDSHDVGARRH